MRPSHDLTGDMSPTAGESRKMPGRCKSVAAHIALLIGVLLAQHSHAGSSVWKVSKDDSYFYLGGTIHVLSLSDYPLPEEFTAAYRDASTIIFETDMSEMESAQTQALFLEALSYDDGRTLSSELAPDTYDKLRAYMDSRYIPIANFSGMQPWGVSLMIAMLEYQRLGMEPENGVDAYFNDLALSEGKETRGLETMAAQLRAIKSMEKIDPDSVIEYTLRDIKQLPEFTRFMKEAWRSGNVEAFSTDPTSAQMKTDFPEMYDALISHRNNAWMLELVDLTKDDTREFVLVGALHLNGQVGLLNQLRILGFDVEQL